MIGKVIRGTSVRRLLYYLYGPGKANEHTHPHLVAGFGDPAELEPERRPSGSRDFRRLAGLLEQPLAPLERPGYRKPVWHCSVRAAPEDRVLSDAEWAQVANAVMHQTGLARDDDDRGVRWVALRHAPDHIHLVAVLARQDGTRPKVWNDFFRVREACLDAERRFGLRATAPADRTAARRATRAETEQAGRRGWPEPPRVTLRREVSVAVGAARTEQEFFARLRQAGVLVRERHSSINPGEITGYAVGLPSHRARDGGVVWYGGGKLAADLTLPKLRARWVRPAAQHDPAAAQEIPGGAVRAVLRNMVAQAAAQSRDEVSFFACLREAGLLVRLRFSEVNPGQVTGYSVTFPGHRGQDGTEQWYGGGRLAADLTLPQLRERWAQVRGTGPEHPLAFRLSAPEREAIYHHAARHARAAAEHIRKCALTDPVRAADSAWAAADTLHVAARALRSPSLRCAADSYDRAARAPYGRIPGATRTGDRLRGAARLLALATDLSGDGTLASAALLGNLLSLVAAVAELRQAQQYAAQAAAARSATAQLHQALTGVRAEQFPIDAARVQWPPEVSADEAAPHEVPDALDLSWPVEEDQPVSRSDPPARRIPLPPRRAGPHP